LAASTGAKVLKEADVLAHHHFGTGGKLRDMLDPRRIAYSKSFGLQVDHHDLTDHDSFRDVR
jgi:hypothetical protein